MDVRVELINTVEPANDVISTVVVCGIVEMVSVNVQPGTMKHGVESNQNHDFGDGSLSPTIYF